MQYNDDKLVQLTLKGDHDAFAILVEKYQSQIHALAPTYVAILGKGLQS